MTTAKIFIGFVDTPFDNNNNNDGDDPYPYETKIGGSPIWCAQPPTQYKDLKCTTCSSELAFLLQAYCPLDSIPNYERNYYIFVCPKCSNSSNGWKIIKCLDPLKEYDDDDEDDDNDDNDNNDIEEEEEQQDDWGVNDDDWGVDNHDNDTTTTSSTTTTNQTISEMIKNRDKQIQIDNQKSKSQKKQQQQQQQQAPPKQSLRESFNSEQEIISGVVIENDSSNQFKSYYLYIEEEKLKKQQNTMTEDQSIHLQKYQLNDAMDEVEAWSGETYEYVKDRIFSKFLKRINSNPDQCLRYSFGGEPLCMSKEGVEETKNNVPKCRFCGKNKVFEFQILSTIITQIESSNNQPNILDFGNAFIYSCPNNCYDKSKDIFNDVVYIEDSIIIEKAI